MMEPHSGVGGVTPSPMKDRDEICMMQAPMRRVDSTMMGNLYYNPYFSFPDCNCCLSHHNIYSSNHKLRKYMYPEHHKPDTPGNCHYALLSLRLTLKACTLCTALVWCTVFLDANLIGHAAIVIIVLTLCRITVHICLLVNS